MYEGAFARIGFWNAGDTTAKPNIIRGNHMDGIVVQRLSEARIVGNTIENNGGNGILVQLNSNVQASSNTINGNIGDGIAVVQGSGAQLGNDTGTGLFGSPNQTTIPNGGFGVSCLVGGYVDGVRGTLSGSRRRAERIAQGCFDSLR